MTNGLMGVVHFEPDGLFLYEDPILNSEPAQGVPVENRIPFGYLGSGQDLHLAIPGPEYDERLVRVPHSIGFGLGSGIGNEWTGLQLKRAADHEARIHQPVAECLPVEQQAQLMGAESAPPRPTWGASSSRSAAWS